MVETWINMTLGVVGERYMVEGGKGDLSELGQAVTGRTS